MTPWWLLAFSGLLGSAHCVGMCGGIAAMIGLNTQSLLGNLKSQIVFSAGRLMSYATLGALAGFAGKRLLDSVPQIINVPAILCLFSGLFLIREGLLATGLWKRAVTGTSVTGCLIRPLFSALINTPRPSRALVAGLATGLLPCGLVYAFVALAASSHDLLQGLFTMLAFGAGTIPMMVFTGCGTSLLNWNARQRFWKASAWSVILTGILTLGRGVAFLNFSGETAPPACPFCSAKTCPSTTMVESQLMEKRNR